MRYNQLPKIFFTHIPKTMGTTLHHVLEYAYPKSQIYSTAYYRGGSAALLAMDEEQTKALRFIAGHIPEQVYRQKQLEGFVRITGVRQPFKRFTSGVTHLYRACNELVLDLASALAKHRFDEALRLMEPWYLHQSPLAFFMPKPYRKREDLRDAIAVMQAHDLVYTDKNFDDFYLAIARLFGQPIDTTPTMNAAPQDASKGLVPKEFEPYFKEAYPEEYTLYDAALESSTHAVSRIHSLFGDVDAKSFYPPVASLDDGMRLAGWSSRIRYNNQRQRLADGASPRLILSAPEGGKQASLRLVLGILPPNLTSNLTITVNGVDAALWTVANHGQFKHQSRRRVPRIILTAHPDTPAPELEVVIKQQIMVPGSVLLEEVSYS